MCRAKPQEVSAPEVSGLLRQYPCEALPHEANYMGNPCFKGVTQHKNQSEIIIIKSFSPNTHLVSQVKMEKMRGKQLEK